ncbi:DUF6891 domain-containing protein [Zavarzinella formosa]|uniref:DUF6891 domain-containing protein n=1 Tax=Zavarzinella formosa TaxID=360055 RepID=UPI0002F254AB|nr:hypothetical protein [Zavarzinella formosa]
MGKARETPPDDEDSGGVTREDILHWVRGFVWRGEHDREEIAIMIEEQLGEGDEIDPKWLDKEIRREFAAKRKAEKTWPKVTDCDRLDRAFETLEQQGIITLQTAGFTQSDGLEEVEDAYRDAGGKKSGYAGHCFFTEQDQEGALSGGGLHIGFGHLSGNDSKGVEVGRMVRAALEQEGLKVKWNGKITSRLYVKEFLWQRRGA